MLQVGLVVMLEDTGGIQCAAYASHSGWKIRMGFNASGTPRGHAGS